MYILYLSLSLYRFLHHPRLRPPSYSPRILLLKHFLTLLPSAELRNSYPEYSLHALHHFFVPFQFLQSVLASLVSSSNVLLRFVHCSASTYSAIELLWDDDDDVNLDTPRYFIQVSFRVTLLNRGKFFFRQRDLSGCLVISQKYQILIIFSQKKNICIYYTGEAVFLGEFLL